jgi:nucleotide-binding universal stress UspA family protein
VRRFGDAADLLVALAEELDADVIVVGRRGEEEALESGPGSVSADIFRRAARDVLVVGRA